MSVGGGASWAGRPGRWSKCPVRRFQLGDQNICHQSAVQLYRKPAHYTRELSVHTEVPPRRLLVFPSMPSCIRDTRVPVSLLVNLVANGTAPAEIIEAYPYLEPEDVQQALQYAAWLTEEKVDAPA